MGMYIMVAVLLSCSHMKENVRGQHILLSLDHQRQDYNMCVPTAASIVIDYYGEQISPIEIKKLATPPNSDFAGTYYSDLVKGVKALGYEWTVMIYTTDDSGFETGFAEIRSELDMGHPVIVSTSDPPIGHTMVMVGYDTLRKEVSFTDPNRPAPGKRTLTYSEFKNIWHENISNLRAFIQTNPKI